MLCRKIKQTFLARTTLKNIQYQCLITSRYFSKRCILERLTSKSRMSSIRLVWKDLVVARLWSAWSRSFIVNTVVKRCRRDRSVRDVFHCYMQAVFRPRRTFLLSATAAFKSKEDGDESSPSCDQSISDEDLQALVSELEDVEQLSRTTLFCTGCGKRLVVDKKQTGSRYCACKDPSLAEDADGWVPYMEAEDVVIWRKEYKPGQGLFAYKIYGRYKEVRAADFAAVQVDSAYRRVWDSAVASLSVIERQANGIADQAVLHWEVLWPRLFANRDYVYIRRHAELDVVSSLQQDGVFEPAAEPEPARQPERPSVHSRAKRKAMEMDARNRMRGPARDNKAFIIINRSCSHPGVPESGHAIRVHEYWSHMVVRSIDGAAQPGMEFVLTYYDEPAVGGLPCGVAAWATGRAAPAYLERMRRAAAGYKHWTNTRPDQDLPEFSAFGTPQQEEASEPTVNTAVREEDMESSKHGPDLDNGVVNSSSTECDAGTSSSSRSNPEPPPNTHVQKNVETTKEVKALPEVKAESPSIPKYEDSPTEADKSEDEEPPPNSSWWRYLYPFYYFV